MTQEKALIIVRDSDGHGDFSISRKWFGSPPEIRDLMRNAFRVLRTCLNRDAHVLVTSILSAQGRKRAAVFRLDCLECHPECAEIPHDYRYILETHRAALSQTNLAVIDNRSGKTLYLGPLASWIARTNSLVTAEEEAREKQLASRRLRYHKRKGGGSARKIDLSGVRIRKSR